MTVAGDRHLLRQGQAPLVFLVRDGRAAALPMDMLVEMPRRDAPGRAEDGDAALRELTPNGVPGENTGPLEALLVLCFGVGDVHLPAHRVHSHAVKDGTDTGVESTRAGHLSRWASVCVDHKYILVGQRKSDGAVP